MTLIREMPMNRIIVSAFILIWISASAIAQSSDFNFYNLSLKDGLPTNDIRFVYQDSYGFLWMGSYEGLIRWDGYTFKRYTHEENQNTLSNNIVYCIFEDSKKRLWIGTIDGLNLFNRNTDEFVKCKIDKIRQTNPVNAIAEDAKGKLWLGTSSGLCQYNHDTGQAKWFIQGNDNNITANKDVIFCLTIDKADNIWLGTFSGGVQKFDQSTESFTSFKNAKGNAQSICSDDIRSILADTENNIWVGSRHEGITVMSETGTVIHHYKQFPNNKISSTQSTINCIFQDKHERIWIGIDREPLYYIDKATQKAVRMIENETALSLSKVPHSISSIHEDSFNNIWFASTAHGLYSMNPHKNLFKNYLNDPGSIKGLKSNVVTCLYEDEKKAIWIGTEEGGLIKFDPGRNIFTPNPVTQKLTSEGITDIKGDRSGNLWLSTWSGGIIKFNPENGNVQSFIHNEANKKSLIYNDVKTLLINDSLIWIGTNGAGLAVYDLNKKEFIHYKNNPVFNFQMNEPGWINHLFKDSKHRIWISTYNGIFVFDRGKIKHFEHTGNPGSLSSNSVNMVAEDNAGKVWIINGTGGLDEYLEKDGKFVRHTDKFRWKESLKAIIADKNGTLWVSGNDGVFAINPSTLKYKKYDNADGLMQDAFFGKSILLSKTGELYIGGHNGFSVFHPDSLKPIKRTEKFYFTDLYIFNEIQKPKRDDSPLQKVLPLTDKLVLNHHQSFFSIEFAALDLYSPGKIRYAYKLEGLHNEWINLQKERKVSFTNLDPGNYELKIKYAELDGEWTTATESLAITILPPWWNTLWFRLFSLVTVTGVVIAVFYLRVSSIKKRNKLLKLEVEKRTQELSDANSFLVERNDEIEHQNEEIKLQNEKLEIYNEEILNKSDKILVQQQHITTQNYALEHTVDELQKLNQTKDHFFSILAHDLKNPIAGLTGIAEYLKKNFSKLEKKDAYEHLTSIHKSANAVYDLLINLLNWSRTQSKNIEYSPIDFNLYELIQKNAVLMEQQFNFKNIELHIEMVDEFNIYADYNMMDAVVRNLLSNSVKFTDYNGKIAVSALGTEHAVTLLINDSGVGMSKEQLERLFKVDKNNVSKGTAGEHGTGLGLVISHEFVKANNGTIHVESEIGKGTTFHVTVPRSNCHFDPVPVNNFKSNSFNGKASIEFLEKLPLEKLIKIKGKKILIVDDNKELRTYLKFLLSSTFEIYEAENGADGVTVALDIQPAIIISDLIMPIMDGAQFCQKIKTTTATSHIPIILLTSQATEEGQLSGYEAGADVYLTKPVKKEILIRVILNFIQNQEKIWQKVQENILDASSTFLPDLSISKLDEEFLNKLIQFVEANISNQNIDSELICDHLGVSRTALYSKIKTLTGQGVHELVKSIRIKKSLKLLLEGKYSIGQITLEVGFTSHSYFNKCFLKQYGMAPKEYVAMRRHKNQGDK
jgi:ligand-binding sensor domain-containing protein/signal transduction histidine kinase/CheY-like chemotaxis protein/AraC-like DNA-binding protein